MDIGLSPAPDFATFTAWGNEPVLQVLEGLAPGCAPVYLWGPSGCGKTHLLRAVEAKGRCDGRVPAWIDSRWGAQGIPEDVDLLLLDDAQSWTAAQQQGVFAAYLEVTARGGVVAAAGLVPPTDLPVREDVRTRLAWGLVLSVQPLSEDGLRLALQDQAAKRGLQLADGLLDYALRRLSRDLKSLSGLLDRLDRYALQRQRPLTVPLLREMLDEEQSSGAGVGAWGSTP